MVDSIRNGSLSKSSAPPASLAQKSAASAAPLPAPSPAVQVQQQAPATHLAAAAAAKSVAPGEDTAASTHVGASLNVLASAKSLGDGFSFLGMTEGAALAVTNSALKAAHDAVGVGFARGRHGFAPRLAVKDQLGMSHVRLDRSIDGVPVFGEQAVAHLDASGAVTDITSNALPATTGVSPKPTIAADSASATALADVRPQATLKSCDLVYAKTDDGAYHLAYYVQAGPSHRFVDAHSGALLPIGFDETGYVPSFVIDNPPELPPARENKGAKQLEAGTGNSLYNGEVKLTTTKENNRYVLRDPLRLNSETRDAQNEELSLSRLVTDDDNKWGVGGDDPRVRAAVDAQWAATNFLDYLKEIFGRNSIDGRGQPLQSEVHVGQAYNNANWDGSSMNYGDGDGKLFGPLVDQDVGSHEPTHGLTQHTCGLIYRGESGALNEAASDIIGSAGFSWFVHGKGDAVDADFKLGEHCYTPGKEGDALRYMAEPERDKERNRGDRYSRDNYNTRYKGVEDGGGVHLNSGIANNFFYLLCQGGTNPSSGNRVAKGIGMEKALQIYYRAHTIYFTPSTNFAQARAACVRAAGDLYGKDSAEAQVVAEAWTAVGVNEKPAAPQTLVG